MTIGEVHPVAIRSSLGGLALTFAWLLPKPSATLPAPRDDRSVRRLLDAVFFSAAIVTGVVSRRPVRPLGDEDQRPLPGDDLLARRPCGSVEGSARWSRRRAVDSTLDSSRREIQHASGCLMMNGEKIRHHLQTGRQIASAEESSKCEAHGS